MPEPMVDPRKRKVKHLKHKSKARHASQTNIQRSSKDGHGGKIEFDEIQKAAAGRHSVFDTRNDYESPSLGGLIQLKDNDDNEFQSEELDHKEIEMQETNILKKKYTLHI